MSIRIRNYQISDPEQIRALKNMVGVWCFGIILIIVGLYFFPHSKILGISLIAFSLVVVPFIISNFIRH